MEIKMTDATFQPSLSRNQNAITKPDSSAQIAVSFIRFLLRSFSVKRPVNADALLAAQARSEAARRRADNLLR